MLRLRPRFFLLLILLISSAGVSCTRDKAKQSADSVSAAPTPVAVSVAPSTSTGWDEAEAGAVILAGMTEAVRQSAVILPNEADIHDADASDPAIDSVRGNEFDLFDRSGKVGVATLEAVSDPPAEGCSAWPVGTFREPPPKSWRVAFGYRTAQPAPLDSLEVVGSADSSMITSNLARLASALTATGDPAFQGLPFTVREGYRMKLTGTSVIIGDVVRTINEEANPREEHLLLVAEKTSSDSEYRSAFYSRSAGSEEDVRTSEILAAVQFVKTNRAAIVISFEYADGGRLALLERIQPGSWKLTWRSAYSGC